MRTIYATFGRIGNAKAAVGRVKKESWNRADFTIISPGTPLATTDADLFEFGAEAFLDYPESSEIYQWPALQEYEIDGIGKVKMAVSFKPDLGQKSDLLNAIDKELIIAGLKENKITAIIGVDDEIAPKIETILKSEGANITFSEKMREELRG